MKYMLIDATGLKPAFYSVDVHGPAVLADGSPNPAYPKGVIEIDDDVWMDFLTNQGQRKWNPQTEAFDAYAPPPPAPPPRTQLGTVFLGAIVDLGWWGWMDQGAAYQAAAAPNGAGKPLDARYWTSIGKADQVLATDAKLNRVAAAAERARVAASGQPAPASPVITVAAAMDHGDAMVAAAAPAAAAPPPASGS